VNILQGPTGVIYLLFAAGVLAIIAELVQDKRLAVATWLAALLCLVASAVVAGFAW
jgi:hypothetical protein